MPQTAANRLPYTLVAAIVSAAAFAIARALGPQLRPYLGYALIAVVGVVVVSVIWAVLRRRRERIEDRHRAWETFRSSRRP